MLKSVVGGLEQDRQQRILLKLLLQITQHLSEWPTSVLRTLSNKVANKEPLISTILLEALFILRALSHILENLSEDSMLTLVITHLLIIELSRFNPADSNGLSTTSRQLSNRLLNHLVLKTSEDVRFELQSLGHETSWNIFECVLEEIQ